MPFQAFMECGMEWLISQLSLSLSLSPSPSMFMVSENNAGEVLG